MNNNNQVCASSELDLFITPPVQTSILSTRWVEYTPSTPYDNGSLPIIIDVIGTSGDYIDLSNIFLYMKATIVKNGKPIEETDKIGPINYILNSMFKQLDVNLNKKLVSCSNDTYPFRALFEALLNFNSEAKSTHLQSSLFFKDDSNAMESITFEKEVKQERTGRSLEHSIQDDDEVQVKRVRRDNTPPPTNTGLLKRRSPFIKQTCELYGRLHADIFNINKYLLDNVDISIKLTRASDQFCLMGEPGYSIQISDVFLNVRKVKISNDVLLAHALALEKTTAKYPITRVVVEARTINMGVFTEKFENIVKGPLPKRIVMGMIHSSAFNGNMNHNPFNFQHFNLSELSISIDGEYIPYQPFKFDYGTSSTCLLGYYSLFSGIDSSFNSGNDITLNDFKNGYNLLAFDLSPDGCNNGDHFNIDKTGNLRINFRFKESLKHAITVILYMEFDNLLEITKLRNVIYDIVG